MVSVGGDPSGRIRETVVKNIQAAEIVRPKQDVSLQLKIPGHLVELRSSVSEENLLSLLFCSFCFGKFKALEKPVDTVAYWLERSTCNEKNTNLNLH